ncbi:MAG: hypothetical protein COA91_09235 [Robiginitomaculum sp.]|nr:MAG: hypothetical protein COA91_09235 [Robiginitomaculum sp.]
MGYVATISRDCSDTGQMFVFMVNAWLKEVKTVSFTKNIIPLLQERHACANSPLGDVAEWSKALPC